MPAPAVVTMERIMSAFFSFFATMIMISFSLAIDTLKNFSVTMPPVPFAWITVPPPAPAALAASITASVCPSFAIARMSSYSKFISGAFISLFPPFKKLRVLPPPTLLIGTEITMPLPGASM